MHCLSDMTWEEVGDTDRVKAVAILPVGAVEALGPHLPLERGIRTLAIASSHLDPEPVATLRAAAAADPDGLRVVSVGLTRRAAAGCITDEFRIGACHYFGWPAQATVEEGREAVHVPRERLTEAVVAGEEAEL